MTENSVTEPVEYKLGPNSRTTIAVDDQPGLENANVSTMVEATGGVVVERSMYFNYENGKAGGSDSIGANQTSRSWYLAEGSSFTSGQAMSPVARPEVGDRMSALPCQSNRTGKVFGGCLRKPGP